MTQTPSNPNPEFAAGITPLYDPAGHQEVAERAYNVATDSTTGVVYGDPATGAGGGGSNASVGTDGIAAPTSATEIGASDGTNLRPLTAAVFHNMDNQALPATAYGLLTGGIAQIINPAGTADRQRGTGFDGIPATGVPAGTQQLAGAQLSTTFGAGGVTGNTNAQSVLVASSANAKVGDIVLTQDNAEYVEITAIADGTHVTGIFKNNHASGQTLTWFHYNQARDASIGDAVALTGLSPSQTYLYNNVTGKAELERSANGELDGASGQGTNLAAEYEFNGGGPASGNYDRARNLQGKGLQTSAISSGGTTGSNAPVLASVPGLQSGQQVLLSGGSAPEIVYTSASYVPGTTTLALSSNIQNGTQTTATWSAFAAQGPDINEFLIDGEGTEFLSLYNESTKRGNLWRGINGVATFQDWIRYQTLMGKVFSVSTGKIASSAVGIVGWQLFNNSTAKNALLISLLLIFNSSNQHLINLTTANANTITGWSGNDNALIPVNNKAGGGASVMTSSYTNANITGSLIGSTREVTGTQNNQPIEILTNGECILLPANAAYGIAVFVSSGVANPWSVTATYIEY